MSLEVARDTLTEQLLSGFAFEPEEHKNTCDLIDRWWFFYKHWEERDTFLDAFKAGRMTVRQGPASQTYGEYQGKDSGIAFAASRGEDRALYPGERYRVGIDSIKERMNPANLATLDGGERLKYKHGLHDLSASLCTPNVPQLSKQVRWKNEAGKLSEWITIFMPVAEPFDHTLFILLNLKAKRARNASPEIFRKVREMSKQMTRIKLAAPEDIGAGLRDVSTNNIPKFKYGNKGDSELDFSRFKNALDYTSILPKPSAPKPPVPMPTPSVSGPGSTSGPPPPPPPMQTGATSTNEIVLCYRQHAGDRFPLFTQWDGRYFTCLPGESGSKWIVNGRIPDRWAQTVELSR